LLRTSNGDSRYSAGHKKPHPSTGLLAPKTAVLRSRKLDGERFPTSSPPTPLPASPCPSLHVSPCPDNPARQLAFALVLRVAGAHLGTLAPTEPSVSPPKSGVLQVLCNTASALLGCMYVMGYPL
jgi:hypothetical protein